ncbi:glycosyltransferase [Micromonospora sp. KC606]|uniref:glycosyltransferase n=1 Tax=Micromonospora sp. KC606 TaxID=2530379 RepID=UPI00104A82B9|nr:glycosyltransferase [Micromonospora sp. KC606]TDC86140.1 glycosyltransferase [Micromonospora sp. KC606]
MSTTTAMPTVTTTRATAPGYLARFAPGAETGAPRSFDGDVSAPGVTVLIPTYSPPGGGRTVSLWLCLSTVLAAVPGAALLVVDNGLSVPDARVVGELLRGTGREHRIIAAPRASGTRYTAAQARNAGLAFLAHTDGSALRRRLLLFLDDDTALAPGALARLQATLDTNPRAIAACPRVVPVPDLDGWLRRRPGGATTLTHGVPGTTGHAPATASRRLPGALNGDGYDLLSVTSHGSLITGRTVGLLVRQDPVLWWIRHRGPLFYEGTPYGSSEDMLAMALLSRLGELWAVPAAEVVDEARKTPGATRAQQFAWGYDHAWLARALAEAGAIPPGVNALAWRDTGWVEYRFADWGPHAGFLINPAELRLGYRMLRAITADQEVAGAMFGVDAGRVRAGTHALGRVLRRWHASAGAASCRPRPDLPPRAGRDWAGLRDGMDALVGHLAGNVVGSLDHGPFFLYGARQPAVAPPS